MRSSKKEALDNSLTGDAQLMAATSADTIHDGGGKWNSSGHDGSPRMRSSWGVSGGGCTPFWCGGRGEKVVEVVVTGVGLGGNGERGKWRSVGGERRRKKMAHLRGRWMGIRHGARRGLRRPVVGR
jgi:hypothetical protein